MKKTKSLTKIQESTNEVVKALRKQASLAAKGENVESAMLIVFEKNNTVLQIVSGDLRLYKAIGALEILKTDLLNQADQLEQGDLI